MSSNINYIHFFPKGLLKNWGNFTWRYDFTNEKWTQEFTSLNRIASYKKPSKEMTQLWNNREKAFNSEFILEEKELESIVSEYLQVKSEDIKGVFQKIKNIPPGTIQLFIKMLMTKSPNIRSTKQFITTLDDSEKERCYSDEAMIWLPNSLTNEVRKQIKEEMDEMNYPQCFIFSVQVPLPFIDPGHNTLYIHGVKSFIFQISPTIIAVYTSIEIAEKIRKDILENRDKLWGVNKAIGWLTSNNMLLRYVYFTKETYKIWNSAPNPKLTTLLQEKYNVVDKNKPLSYMAFATALPKYNISIHIDNDYIISVSLNAPNNGKIMEHLFYHENFKYMFRDFSGLKKFHKMEMQDLIDKKIKILDNKVEIN